MKDKLKRSPTAKGAGRNQLRIIGGKWRGRKLDFPSLEGLRPTGDRIRETLFNWLAAEMPGACCLDLFAGSGALGFEALSRGARRVIMIEQQREALDQLRRHRSTLHAEDGAEIIQGDAISWLKQASAGGNIDIVFVDPPFAGNLHQATIDALETSNALATSCWIYMESDADQAVQTPASWHEHRAKHSGKVSYRLFWRAGEEGGPAA